ncbi:MAG: hypothetical protein M0R76_05275 [Proteobacteria bacterium]|nr:hypothetical protein [Pseudomonadota bacterium]
MNRMVLAPIFIVFFISACATASQQAAPNISANFQASSDQIYEAAIRFFAESGYMISSSDKASGVITAVLKEQKFTGEDCDCGMLMGIPYIKDSRTRVDVLVNLIVADGYVNVKTILKGKFPKGQVTQETRFDCVSKGSIEQGIVSAIEAAITRIPVATTVEVPPAEDTLAEDIPAESEPTEDTPAEDAKL